MRIKHTKQLYAVILATESV